MAGSPSTARDASWGFSSCGAPWGSKSAAVRPFSGPAVAGVELGSGWASATTSGRARRPSGVRPRPRLKAITEAIRTSRQAATTAASRSQLAPGCRSSSGSSSSTNGGRVPLPVPAPVPSQGQKPDPLATAPAGTGRGPARRLPVDRVGREQRTLRRWLEGGRGRSLLGALGDPADLVVVVEDRQACLGGHLLRGRRLRFGLVGRCRPRRRSSSGTSSGTSSGASSAAAATAATAGITVVVSGAGTSGSGDSTTAACPAGGCSSRISQVSAASRTCRGSRGACR